MEIPLFPLPKLVIFPNIVVPLHIFEDRYKLMINECIDHDGVFGLVLLRSGAQEESDQTIHRIGVTARVVDVERLEDGRMNILSQGESRFQIFRMMQKTPYWKASVEFLEDRETLETTEPLYSQVSSRYLKVIELGRRLDIGSESDVTLPESPTDLSYLISYVMDIDSEEKQILLEMTSAAERLRALIDHLDETIRKLEQRIALKELLSKAQGNGDLGKPRPR